MNISLLDFSSVDGEEMAFMRCFDVIFNAKVCVIF